MGLLLTLAVYAMAGEKDVPIRFSAPKDRVFAAAMIIVSKDAARVEQVNQEGGFISYVAWYSKLLGVRFPISITLISEDDGKATRVLVVCEKSEVKKKAIRAIADELYRQGLIPQSEIPGSH